MKTISFWWRLILSTIFLALNGYWKRYYCTRYIVDHFSKNPGKRANFNHFKPNFYDFYWHFENNLLLTINCWQYQKILSTIKSSSIIVNDNCKRYEISKFNQFFSKKNSQKNFMNNFPIFLKNCDNRRSILATHDSRTPLPLFDTTVIHNVILVHYDADI